MRWRRVTPTFALAAVLALGRGWAEAHPGKTDAKGCHTCSTNCGKHGLKNGQYHCHGKKSSSGKKKGTSKKPRKPR